MRGNFTLMRFLLFWIMRPRFGVFSLACIIAALALPTIFGVLLAAGAILVETFYQNIFKRVLLSRIRSDYKDF